MTGQAKGTAARLPAKKDRSAAGPGIKQSHRNQDSESDYIFAKSRAELCGLEEERTT